MRRAIAVGLLAMFGGAVGIGALPAFAAKCPLEQARFESEVVILEFGRANDHEFQVILPRARFTGYVNAISGFGYVAYEAWEGGTSNDGDTDVTGTVYGLGLRDGFIKETGAWIETEAPPAILFADLGRGIYYHMRDAKRADEFEFFSDLFTFKECLPKRSD